MRREFDDPVTIICRCEEISAGEILRAIEQGASTIGDVKRRTRAGMGLCQGKTCNSLLLRLLGTGEIGSLREVQGPSYRPPVRPLPLSALGQESDENS